MRYRVTVIPSSGRIIVEGRSLELKYQAPANIHAIQWQGQQGFIEFNDGKAVKSLTVDDYDLHVKPYVKLWEAEALRLDSCPGPAYDWDETAGRWVYNLEKDSPGPEYRLIDGVWVKIIFSKKDFLLKCGLNQVARLNLAIANGNPLAKTVHDLLFDAEYIDLTDPATAQMLTILTTGEAEKILTTAEVSQILTGVPHVAQT